MIFVLTAGPGTRRDELLSLLKQLQIRDDVGLVLNRELDRKVRVGREHVRVERGELLERLCAIVMEVRSGLLHAPERRDLEHAGEERRVPDGRWWHTGRTRVRQGYPRIRQP